MGKRRELCDTGGNVCECNKKKHNTKTDMQPIRTGDDCLCVGGNERKCRDRHTPNPGERSSIRSTQASSMAIAPKSPDGKREILQADQQTTLCIDYDQPGYKSQSRASVRRGCCNNPLGSSDNPRVKYTSTPTHKTCTQTSFLSIKGSKL